MLALLHINTPCVPKFALFTWRNRANFSNVPKFPNLIQLIHYERRNSMLFSALIQCCSCTLSTDSRHRTWCVVLRPVTMSSHENDLEIKTVHFPANRLKCRSYLFVRLLRNPLCFCDSEKLVFRAWISLN